MAKHGPKPWCTGPGEILEHGLELLRDDSERNRRLALIAIDNAVELTLKTFLGLPKRVTGIQISRSKFGEISESFPKLLDALEEHAEDRISGIDLGEVEWFHRLRNQLYHQGNGLTVERSKVEFYASLAELLFSRLFEADLFLGELLPHEERLGRFVSEWAKFEKSLIDHTAFFSEEGAKVTNLLTALRALLKSGELSPELNTKVDRLRQLRNQLVHGHGESSELLTDEVFQDLREVLEWARKQCAKC